MRLASAVSWNAAPLPSREGSMPSRLKLGVMCSSWSNEDPYLAGPPRHGARTPYGGSSRDQRRVNIRQDKLGFVGGQGYGRGMGHVGARPSLTWFVR